MERKEETMIDISPNSMESKKDNAIGKWFPMLNGKKISPKRITSLPHDQCKERIEMIISISDQKIVIKYHDIWRVIDKIRCQCDIFHDLRYLIS